MNHNMPTNVDELIKAASAGSTFRYVFFWGHTPKKPGTLGAECLSQWYPSPFEASGERYATAEHFMMAGKARLFGDEEAEARVFKATSPGEAKAIGRQVRGFRSEVWNRERSEVVVRGNLAKFSSDDALCEWLLGTGDRVLVEASPHDAIWGIGLTASDPRSQDPRSWKGENLLGFALMETRRRLRDGRKD